MKCPECGQWNRASMPHCTRCGAPLNIDAASRMEWKDSLRDEAKEKSWLVTIAVNVCRDYLRSPWAVHINRRVQPEELRIAADQPDGTQAEIMAAVMNLPRKYMEAVTLRYIQGYDIRETAEMLGITPSAVSRRCRKACILLKDRLEGREDRNG